MMRLNKTNLFPKKFFSYQPNISKFPTNNIILYTYIAGVFVTSSCVSYELCRNTKKEYQLAHHNMSIDQLKKELNVSFIHNIDKIILVSIFFPILFIFRASACLAINN